jgi:hypothetical protein
MHSVFTIAFLCHCFLSLATRVGRCFCLAAVRISGVAQPVPEKVEGQDDDHHG